MVRLILFLLLIAALATGLSWLADRPGDLVIHWQGYEVQTSVFRAVVLFAALFGATVFVLSLVRQLWQSPAAVGHFINRRRQKKGLEALSTGMIAIGAGDRATATRYAIQARKSLPNEPLTHLLRAQAAQLSGDKATARRIFEAMLGAPDTEQLGLRGLYLEAERENETEAARQFAERAMRLNPKLGWSVDALFDLQCKLKDWAGALETLNVARRNGQVERAIADRRRAVLLTAQAQELEEADPEKALALSQEAHGLAPELVPAAAIAGRLLASRGSTPKATKIVQKTWSCTPHPDLATAYAYARIGDSPRDRLDRVKQLAAQTPNSIESAIAVATAAIEARDFDIARKVLEPLQADARLSHRACLLMARIEGEQNGDRGRVREWLARAVHAPRDPVWTADGVVSDRWAAVSPVTGQLDAFQWRVPVENVDQGESELLAAKLEELIALGAPVAGVGETVIDAKATDARSVAKPEPVKSDAGKPAQSSRDAVIVDVEPVAPQPAKSVAAADASEARGAGPVLREATVTVKSTAAPLNPLNNGAVSIDGGSHAAPVTSAKPVIKAKFATPPPTAAAATVAAVPAPKPTPVSAPPSVAAQPAPMPVSPAPQQLSAKPAATPVTTASTPGTAHAGAAAQANAKSAAASSAASSTQRPVIKDSKAPPRIIVPDDPGPGGEDDDLPKSPLRSLRAGS